MPFGVLSGFLDIIISAKFYVNRSRGFSGAARQKCHFLYLFEQPLQQFCIIVQTVIAKLRSSVITTNNCFFYILQTTIDILKMDIDCSEWTSFDAILANPRCLANVKQLMVEFHPCRGRQKDNTPEQLLSYWRILRGIDALGFKLWKIWNNYLCWFQSKRLKPVEYCGCFNAHYLNIKYLL